MGAGKMPIRAMTALELASAQQKAKQEWIEAVEDGDDFKTRLIGAHLDRIEREILNRKIYPQPKYHWRGQR